MSILIFQKAQITQDLLKDNITWTWGNQIAKIKKQRKSLKQSEKRHLTIKGTQITNFSTEMLETRR